MIRAHTTRTRTGVCSVTVGGLPTQPKIKYVHECHPKLDDLDDSDDFLPFGKLLDFLRKCSCVLLWGEKSSDSKRYIFRLDFPSELLPCSNIFVSSGRHGS